MFLLIRENVLLFLITLGTMLHSVLPMLHSVLPMLHSVLPMLHSVLPIFHSLLPMLHSVPPIFHSVLPLGAIAFLPGDPLRPQNDLESLSNCASEALSGRKGSTGSTNPLDTRSLVYSISILRLES